MLRQLSFVSNACGQYPLTNVITIRMRESGPLSYEANEILFRVSEFVYESIEPRCRHD